jgi:tRNA-(ms[2]io[6]A)-hydroxylase
VLNLACDSAPGWAARAIGELEELLLDHAHCEKKAASSALAMIFRYPEYPQLAIPLSRLAREELAHFEQVLGVMRGRGMEFRRQHPSRYAGRLMKAVRVEEPLRAVDSLLCCALIEARSCERMQRLAEVFESGPFADAELAALYGGLLASEARHHTGYLELARSLGALDDEALRARLAELAQHEAQVCVGEADEGIRMHT